MKRPRRPGSRRIHKLSELRRSVAHGLREDVDIGIAGPTVGNSLALGEGNQIDLCSLADRVSDQVETGMQEGCDAVGVADGSKCFSGGLVERNRGAPCQFSGKPATGCRSHDVANRRPDAVCTDKHICTDL